jgi:acyl-CoA synthetase (AMP-forming)/AMP-acid ligase II
VQSESSLTAWIQAPEPTRAIRFATGADGWEVWSYERLATLARQAAAGLAAAGVRRGDVVTIVDRSGPAFVGALFGALLAGATASPIAPPLAFQDAREYAAGLRGRLAAARPALVVAPPDLRDRVAELARPAWQGAVVALDELAAGGPPPPASRASAGTDVALLQFTSGSGGRARGVRVPTAALAANVAAIAAWLEMTADDATASWLPVHHDMGLVGCLITPVVHATDLWLLTPEQFVREPLRYLRCFGRGGARLSAMPCFGLAHVATRVDPAALALEDLDLGDWRALIVGAEPVDPRALRDFHELLAAHGLRRDALLPAYGLAEATLAVTGLPRRTGWRAVDVDPSALAIGRRVDGRAAPGGRAVVGCGQPLAGVGVEVHDEAGAALADGAVGEIVVDGASVAAGYAAPDDGRSATAFAAGAVRTGDAGFLLDGELFVIGRLGDALKVRGRAVFAEDVEAALVAEGLPARRIAAALGDHAGAATAVLVIEGARPGWSELAARVLRRRTAAATLVVVDAPQGTIRRTPSGKPRRRELWNDFLEQRLDGTVLPTERGVRV